MNATWNSGIMKSPYRRNGILPRVATVDSTQRGIVARLHTKFYNHNGA